MIEIKDRIDLLREFMKKSKMDAYIVYHTDPHQSEYPIAHYLERQWLSGFHGSAGTLVITEQQAGLWTDARYYLQAEQELEGSGISLFKSSLSDTPSIEQWLTDELAVNSCVGFNPTLITVSQHEALAQALQAKSIRLVGNDLIKKIWLEDRPELPQAPISIHPEIYSGESSVHKLDRIKEELVKTGVDGFFIGALDEVAWTFNIRGNDTPCNPVGSAYAYVGIQETVLFVEPEKLSPEVRQTLKDQGVNILGYKGVERSMKAKSNTQRIGFDANKTNWAIHESLHAERRVPMTSPILALKAIKNKTEIAGFKKAMVEDGIALTHFFYVLQQNIKKGKSISERDAVKLLDQERQKSKLYRENSFGTIAGYAEHGAIIHYHATEEMNAVLKAEGFFLLDSGGQYACGTTDITRTVHLGKPNREEKSDYTQVLKAHIAVARAKFPTTAHGIHVDMFARQVLWMQGLDFPHGTGHGVGSYLNVHEGPQAIRINDNGITLKAGMVTSNEPGLYREGKYGIRTENLLLCKKGKTTSLGDFLAFETLTLFPFDRKCIEKKLLSSEERIWLNKYHKKVYNSLSPKLASPLKKWLAKQCAKI